jgi:hypothetical protein
LAGEFKAIPVTVTVILKEAASDFDGKDYDEGYDEYAKTRMW